MNRITEWIKNNLVCVLLVTLFIPLFIVTTMNEEIFNALAGTDFKYLEGQYYRWFTAIFIHHSIGHIFFQFHSINFHRLLDKPLYREMENIVYIYGRRSIGRNCIFHCGEFSVSHI